MIKGIILDWGGVLCEDPSRGFIEYCAQQFSIEPEILGPAVALHLPAFMMGLPEMQFWGLVCAQLSISKPTQELWGRAIEAVYRPLEITLATARELRAQGMQIGLLSNTEPPSKLFHLRQGYEFFSARVFSCDENIAKPNPAIYLLAAERIGLPASECLMVDDRAENIAGAERAGMQTYLFTSPEAFRKDLRSKGLLR